MAVSEITISQLGPKGDGIGRGPKGPVYIERAVPGDRLKARLYRDSFGVSRGDIANVLKPSLHRRPAPCAHFNRCGNCSLQHLEAGFYRNWKTRIVREAFGRYGQQPERWHDTVFIGEASRRRLTLSARKERGRVILGYYRRRSQEVTEVDTCLVAEPKLWAVREPLKAFLAALLKEGQSLDVFLQLSGGAVDMLITGTVGRVPKLPEGLIARLSVRANEKSKPVVIFSKGSVASEFGRLKVSLPPGAFLQPTLGGEKALVRAVLGAVPMQGRFADLFSGCGTFSGPLLGRGEVDAYESLPWAVNALSKSEARGLRVFRRDLFRSPLRRDELNRYDAIVFDPPRAGCEEQAAEMASARVPVLVGLSCNPATFARDAKILCDGGYKLQSLQVIDQFQWSHHVEVVGVFLRRSGPRQKKFSGNRRKRSG